MRLEYIFFVITNWPKNMTKSVQKQQPNLEQYFMMVIDLFIQNVCACHEILVNFIDT